MILSIPGLVGEPEIKCNSLKMKNLYNRNKWKQLGKTRNQFCDDDLELKELELTLSRLKTGFSSCNSSLDDSCGPLEF